MFDSIIRAAWLVVLMVFLPASAQSKPMLITDVERRTDFSGKAAYHSIRPDLRRFIILLCGGYWIKKAIYESELIAVGEDVVTLNDGPAGDSPVEPKLTSYLSCRNDWDCTPTVYHRLVNSPDECYCPLYPVPIISDAAQENQESWQRHCSNFGFFPFENKFALICHQLLCILPDPVDCVAHQCVSLNSEPLFLQ